MTEDGRIQPEPWYLSHLACPDCSAPMPALNGRATCQCGYSRLLSDKPPDFRPHQPHPRHVTFSLSSSAPTDLLRCSLDRPTLTYDGPAAVRDSAELFSAAAPPTGAALLDLGCGPRDQAVPAEHLGLRYVGVDYTSSSADLLADAHAIPFQAGTFDLVLAYAVLEHLYNPFLAIAEIARVLRPGGVFFGTVSQGEPFHDSFFHHTSWGLLQVLKHGQLNPARIWYSYDTIRALAIMGRYPAALRPLLRAFDTLHEKLPLLSPRKHLKWSRHEKELDALHRTAAICFVAVKDQLAVGDARRPR